jgi:asparagine synthetase B (glutamine-hydrolysing)
MDLPSDDTLLLPSAAPVKMLKEQLLNALRLRVLNVPDTPTISGTATASPSTRIAILFSGGLDCTVLARLCHDLLPEAYAVDLLNVAFENPRVASQLQKQANGAVTDVYESCPDRMTGRKAFAELQKVCPGRTFRLISVSFRKGITWQRGG